MTRSIPCVAQWKGIGRTALCFALDLTGATLMTTGQVLIFCGVKLRMLSARLDPQ